MKNRFARLLFAIAFLGLLSCQQQDRSTGSTSESIPLAMRLVAASGNAIPESDTLRFVVVVGADTTDTLVAWSRHELDLGSAKDGDAITWQAMAWKWDSTKTVRRVVWASQKLSMKARSSGNGQALALETPVQATNVEAPKLAPEGFAIGKGDSVSLPDADGSFQFSFKVSQGADTVRINDSVVAGKNGVYSRTFTVEPGTSLKVKVLIKDTLGSISILSYSLVRASKPVIDSFVKVAFEVPDDTTLSWKDSTLAVRVKTTSMLHLDTVRIGTTLLSKDGADTTLWTGKVDLQVGEKTLTVFAIAGSRRDSASRKVTRSAKLDSSVHVSFRSPTDKSRLAFKDSSIQVEVEVVSSISVASVLVGRDTLTRSGTNDSLWVGQVRGLKVGENTLTAIASTASKKDSATIVVTRAQDSTIATTFVSPDGEKILSNSETSIDVKVKVLTKLSVASVLVGNDSLKKDNDSIWAGTVKGLEEGENILKAIVMADGKRDSATLTVKRAGDSTISALFEDPKASVVLPNSVSVLAVTVKVTSKLNVTSVKIDTVALQKDAQNATLWKGEIRGIAVGTDTLKAVATAGAKTDTAKRAVTRRGLIDKPTFSPEGRRSVGTLPVAIDGPDMADVEYSFDNLKWETYSNPVAISKTQTLYARASKLDMDTSYASARYVIVADTPTFEPASRSSIDSVRVAIKSGMSNAKIFLSTDSLKWKVYSAPIFFDSNVTLYSKVYVEGLDTSAVSKAMFRVAATKPTITPNGNTTAVVDSQVVTLSTTTKGASFAWSTDNSTWQTSGGKVVLKANATLYAKALKSNMDSSEASQASFRIKAAAPKIDPNGAFLIGSKEVKFTSTTPDAEFEYSTSSSSSSWEHSTGSFALSENDTVYARTVKEGMDTSDETKLYCVVKVATPELVSGDRQFTAPQTVVFKTATSGASLQWSTDSSLWKSYETLTPNGVTLDSSVTLYVKATKSGMVASNVLKVTFTDTAFGYPMGNRPRPSAGCGKATGLSSGAFAFNFADTTRSYYLKMPTTYDKDKPYRLVFGMHAMGSSAAKVATDNWYNLVPLDETNSTIWVAPQGESNGTWQRGAKDHMFFDSLLHKIKQDACIDTTRVFAVGFSFGAMFTHSLARDHQRVLRGVAVYGTAEYNIYSPQDVNLPLAWMGTVGLSDQTTPPAGTNGTNGGRGARDRFVGYNGGSITQNVAEASVGGKHVCYDYKDVMPRYPVKWCTFDGTHDDRPKDEGETTSWVPKTTWDFIKQF